MDSRNILTVLIVIFVAVLLYNALYFTGVVGGFGSSSDLPPLEQDPQFAIPGQDLRQQPTPRPSGDPRTPLSAGEVAAPRATVLTADLGVSGDWGRNPFLTPREVWAIANFRPIYLTQPADPPSGLYLSAIVMDSTGRRVAVINGDIVAVGQQYAGMRVLEMTEDGVVFELDGRRHVVRMADGALGLGARGNAAGRY